MPPSPLKCTRGCYVHGAPWSGQLWTHVCMKAPKSQGHAGRKNVGPATVAWIMQCSTNEIVLTKSWSVHGVRGLWFVVVVCVGSLSLRRRRLTATNVLLQSGLSLSNTFS